MKRRFFINFLILIFTALSVYAADEIKVQSVKGTAEVKENEEWRGVSAGDVLKPPFTVRTSVLSRAQISLPDASFIRLLPETNCRVSEIVVEKADKKEIRKIQLKHNGGTVVFSIMDKKNRAEVMTPAEKKIKGSGVFLISVDEDERTLVSVLKGEACVSEENKEVCAKSMQDMELSKKGETKKPEKTAEENLKIWKAEKFEPSGEGEKLFLKVLRPEGEKYFNQQGVFVTGNTLPGARVQVNGKELEVHENGSFSGNIMLFEGKNQLLFTAVAPSGETVSETRTVFLDTTPPLLMVSQPPGTFDPTVFGTCDAQKCYIQIFGLTEPGVLLTINGMDVSRFIGDDGSFLIQDFPINRTDTVLTVQAQDSLQQRSFEVIHIFYSE
ncbi:MAG: FecR domain-containing protein [bacterium]